MIDVERVSLKREIASDQFEHVKTVLLDRGHRMIRGLLRTVPGSEFPRVHSDFAEQASFE